MTVNRLLLSKIRGQLIQVDNRLVAAGEEGGERLAVAETIGALAKLEAVAPEINRLLGEA